MNKAFTREEDFEDDDFDDNDNISSPPQGGKNYITPEGAEKLRSELKDLKYRERPEVVKTVQWAAGNGDRSENGDYIYGKKRLREIDRRVRFLSKRLENAEVIDPEKVVSDQVLFGATVTILTEEGVEKTYSIVGVDEIEVSNGKISWLSPLGNALLKAREGDIVTFRSPKGPQDIEIFKIEYKKIP